MQIHRQRNSYKDPYQDQDQVNSVPIISFITPLAVLLYLHVVVSRLLGNFAGTNKKL